EMECAHRQAVHRTDDLHGTAPPRRTGRSRRRSRWSGRLRRPRRAALAPLRKTSPPSRGYSPPRNCFGAGRREYQPGRTMRNADRLICGGALLLTIGAARAQDWPQWRGPNRDARATGFTAPKDWPKELTRKWKITVGDGVATPALVNDRLYVFT